MLLISLVQELIGHAKPSMIEPQITLMLLSCDDLKAWRREGNSFWKEKGINYTREELSKKLLRAIDVKIKNIESDPGNEKWYSYFGIVHDNQVVGLIGPKGKEGLPDRIEIGYGVGEMHRGKGIASEAVRQICRYYCMNEGIRHIIAKTEHTNPASQKVLIKANFKRIKEDQNEITWQWTGDDNSDT